MSEVSAQKEVQLLDRLANLEVDAVGVASVSQLTQSRLRNQVLKLLPEARSIVVLAGEIYTEVLDHNTPHKEIGEASARDLLAPHQDYVNSRLTKSAYDVCKVSRRLGLKALTLPAANYPTDQRYLYSVLSYKHAAEAAGLGTMGWHSLLMTPQFGPRVRLACVLTQADLPASEKPDDKGCDGCGLCLQACPAQALAEPKTGETYSINRFACSVFRGGSGACSECMRVCPAGR